jgi:hypothetical protein
MALKRLLTEEMVQISGPWTNANSAARKALVSVPELLGIVPRIDTAHAALLEAQPSPDDPRLAALIVQAAAIDQHHDATIRGLYSLLSAHAFLLESGPNSQDASRLVKLRDTLLPDGLQATQLTYRGEAGAAELLVKRMGDDPSLQAELQTIQVGSKTGADYVAEWIDSARKLGALEDERAKLVPSGGAGDGTRVMTARNLWIRAVNALVANAALGEIDAEQDRLIFGALRLAEKTADRRAKSPAVAETVPAAPPKTPGNPALPS